MGELLLCNEAIAAMPYYIEGVSINVYSIEELNYYIINNTYLLDDDFMSLEPGLKTMHICQSLPCILEPLYPQTADCLLL